MALCVLVGDVHNGMSPAAVGGAHLLCQVFMPPPELFLAAALCIHDCGQNDKAILYVKKKKKNTQ